MESLEGTFENPKYNQGKNPFFLQLGIATDTSYECFSLNESKLIIDPIDDEDQTKYIISGHSGYYRFDEKLRDIRRDTIRKTVYYPYYKLEGTLSIEGLDILKDVDNRTTRYERFITSLLSDYFKGWKINTQIHTRLKGGHFWIHLVDKTKIINENISHKDDFFPIEITNNEYQSYLNKYKPQAFTDTESKLFSFDKPYYVEKGNNKERTKFDLSYYSVVFRKRRRVMNSINYYWYKFYFTKLEDEYFLIECVFDVVKTAKKDSNLKGGKTTQTKFLLADGQSELKEFIQQINKFGNSRQTLISLGILRVI